MDDKRRPIATERLQNSASLANVESRLYERKHAARVAGLGAAPAAPTGLGNMMVVAFAGLLGVPGVQ